MNMDKLREGIDQIDDQIANLYSQRMDICKEIGLIKASNGSCADVPQRENAILNRLTEGKSDEMKLYIKQLYSAIFYTSKAYQSQFTKSVSKSADDIRRVLAKNMTAPISSSVACQGVLGSYSNIATEKMFEISNISYFKTFEAVFNAIDKGMCKYGVLPIENSNTGSILQVYDLMQKYHFYIVKSARVQIKHALVAKPGADISKIKTVISHEQGLLQCSNFLKSLGVETHTVENTALAARTVAESDDDTIAAICSTESASIYGLSVLKSNVQDTANNYTRFICISKDMEIYKGADKISVMINASHTPGSLNRVLGRFSALNLNITKLESRPIPNSAFEFMFYFDFEGDVTDDRVLNLIADLENGTDMFVFLGSFKEVL